MEATTPRRRHRQRPPASHRMSAPIPTLRNNGTSSSSSDEAPSSYLPLTLQLPSVSSLRSALLGYLGEAENAVRQRLGLDGEHDFSEHDSIASSPSPSSEDETDFEEPPPTPTTAMSSALNRQAQDVRRRFNAAAPVADSENARQSTPLGARARLTQAMSEADARILQHLRSLREDVAAYAPSMPTLDLQAQQDWIKALPGKLQGVDLDHYLAVPGTWPDPRDASTRAVRSARRRVIDLVHALLPPDDWQGWESLGWESDGVDSGQNTPRRGSHVKSCSLDEGRTGMDDSDSDEDEPEYLFPNRTPAPARDVARQRAFHRRTRSTSDIWEGITPSFLDGWRRPSVHEVAAVVDDEGDEDVLDTVEDSPIELEEVPCEKHGLHPLKPGMGPSIPEALVVSQDGKHLITFKDLPFWWRNNQYIHTHYRFIPLGRNGPIPLLKSAFALHNETVNIHSHFIPTLMILGFIPFVAWRTPLPDAHWVDTGMLISYLLAAMSCMSSSAGWHVLSGCASRRWFEWGACVDYIGISWLIAMSFNTIVYNAYYCRPKALLAYTLVNVAFGSLGSYLPFQKWFNRREYKPYRICFFLSLVFCMFAPVAHMYYREGVAHANAFVAPFMMSIAAYTAGLVCYATHWPECWFPGKFDLWGASHQLWHSAIVIAVCLHYRAIFLAFEKRWDYSCAAPDATTPFPAAVSALLFGSA